MSSLSMGGSPPGKTTSHGLEPKASTRPRSGLPAQSQVTPGTRIPKGTWVAKVGLTSATSSNPSRMKSTRRPFELDRRARSSSMGFLEPVLGFHRTRGGIVFHPLESLDCKAKEPIPGTPVVPSLESVDEDQGVRTGASRNRCAMRATRYDFRSRPSPLPRRLDCARASVRSGGVPGPSPCR